MVYTQVWGKGMGWGGGVRIGDVCLEHSYCTIPHSHCKLAICHCDKGFIPTMQNTQGSGNNSLLIRV